jgi:outer membrane protein TolC
VVRALILALLFSSAALARQLTLDDALKLGLERNTDLRKQILLSLSAEQDLVLARARILPKLDFNASASRTRAQTLGGERIIPGVGATTFPPSLTFSNNYNAGLNLGQLIFDGGKWWNNLSAADLGVAANEAQVDEQRLQITYLIEQRFYELVRAQRQLQVQADAAQRSRDQADFTQRLYEGGRATQADVYAARANRDNDEIIRLGQERVVELARSDLSTAIGLDPGEPLAVVEAPQMLSEPAAPPEAGSAVQRALANRPSLKAFALTLESNRKLVSAAKGDYWPVVSLNGSYGRNAPLWSQFDDPNLGNSSQLSGSVNLTWNIFGGLATNASVRKAELTALMSENDLLAGRRGVAADVEKAVAQLAAARAQARVAVQTEQNAKESLRLARTRQEVGVGTQLEVRDAELKVTQAALARVGALVDGREAEAALRRAQGG